MDRFHPLLAILCVVGAGHVLGLPFQVEEEGGHGFSISLGDTVVMKHSQDVPVLYVGNGQTDFPEISGNFFIKDYTSERIGLTGYSLTCDTESCTVRLSRGTTYLGLLLGSDEGQALVLDITDSSGDFDRVWLRLVAEDTEEVYGGGEQFSFFNLRHRDGSGQNIFPIWTSEQGVGRNKSTQVTFVADNLLKSGGDYYTTYFPQPSFVSSRRYSFHHAGDNYAVLDFGHDQFHEVFILGTPGRMYLNKADTLMALVQNLTSLVGRMPELPEWTQGGAILGVQGGTSTMLSRYQYAKDNGIPVAGLWIQDWSGKRQTGFGSRVNWNWRWDPTWYPELDHVIKNLTRDGVRVLAYINPTLSNKGDLFQEGASKGYFVKNSTGGIYYLTSISFVYGTVDLTNPQAYEWYKNDVVKKNMLGLGLGGWMADFGEYLPADAVLHNGRSGRDMHNAWPRLWARLNREALEETGKLGEVVFFTRAGFSGVSNSSTLMWAGDQNVDFSRADGLHSAIVGSLSMAMSGTGLTHFDIGGYTTFGLQGLSRTPELLMRSGEVAVFTPVFRSHEGNQPQYNEQWYSNGSTPAFSRLARLFALLKDYRISVTHQTSREGIPAQRPLHLHFEGQKFPHTQYMFGPDLLVCPVYLEKVNKQRVVLPSTDPAGYHWVHVWTSTNFPGGQELMVDAPLGQPPVFYRSDSKFKDTFEKLKDVKEMDLVMADAGDVCGG